jgi:hypothetical protein
MKTVVIQGLNGLFVPAAQYEDWKTAQVLAVHFEQQLWFRTKESEDVDVFWTQDQHEETISYLVIDPEKLKEAAIDVLPAEKGGHYFRAQIVSLTQMPDSTMPNTPSDGAKRCECDACGYLTQCHYYEGELTRPSHWFCELCASSHGGNAKIYPQQVTRAQVMAHVSYCTNVLLDAIAVRPPAFAEEDETDTHQTDIH